jgi:hypothetical protein
MSQLFFGGEKTKRVVIQKNGEEEEEMQNSDPRNPSGTEP